MVRLPARPLSRCTPDPLPPAEQGLLHHWLLCVSPLRPASASQLTCPRTASGFGNEYVQIALEAGHKVAAAGRSGSKLSFSSATKDNFLGVDLDVTSASSVHAAFERAHKHFGRIDVLCNNAGYGLAGEFESLTEAQYRKQFDVNVFGLFECTRAALAIMREQGGGVIQQVSERCGCRWHGPC